MKAIVHIGSPKAGSSSIQDFLFLNRDALAARGFRFHRNVDHRGSQFEYAIAAMARTGALIRNDMERIRYKTRSLEEARAATDRFVAELQDYPKRWPEPVAIFSSEHMIPWLHTPELIQSLDEMFSAAFTEVRYIAYFRSPTASIVSQYSERTKRGSSFTLDEFIQRRIKRMDLFRPAKRWANTVGRDRLDVRLFDLALRADGDLISDFSAACGIDPAGLQRPPRANEALSAPAAECLRVLNSMVPEIRMDGTRNPLRSDILETVAEISRDMPRLALNGAQKSMIDQHLAESNEKFRRSFFPDRETLFPEQPDGPQPMSHDSLSDLALELLAKLLIKSRMGELKPLNILERSRAVITDRASVSDQ